MKNEWGDVRLSTDAWDFAGTRVLVIGAGGGPGAACARAFAEAGAQVTLSSVTNDGDEIVRVKSVQRELSRSGAQASTVAMDVTLGANVQVTVRQVAKEMGAIDVLVNAPDLFLGKSLESTTDSEWARVLAVNLGGVFHACRSVSKEMARQGTGGRIVNVASVLGERGMAHAAAYCAAQGGVLNLTRALAQELGPAGVTVNAIAAGWLQGMAAIGDADPASNKTVRFVPMKRAGAPDEVAPLALYLASKSAGYVSGQVLFVDGGLTTHL